MRCHSKVASKLNCHRMINWWVVRYTYVFLARKQAEVSFSIEGTRADRMLPSIDSLFSLWPLNGRPCLARNLMQSSNFSHIISVLPHLRFFLFAKKGSNIHTPGNGTEFENCFLGTEFFLWLWNLCKAFFQFVKPPFTNGIWGCVGK